MTDIFNLLPAPLFVLSNDALQSYSTGYLLSALAALTAFGWGLYVTIRFLAQPRPDASSTGTTDEIRPSLEAMDVVIQCHRVRLREALNRNLSALRALQNEHRRREYESAQSDDTMQPPLARQISATLARLKAEATLRKMRPGMQAGASSKMTSHRMGSRGL